MVGKGGITGVSSENSNLWLVHAAVSFKLIECEMG